MAGDFALGGGDIVKDDHNLVAATVDEFHRRVGLCHAAVEAANAATGRNCVYLCNLSAPFDQLAEQMECALSLGVRGVMVAPMALGLDTVRHLSETRPLIMLAHPTFTGTFFHDRSHGIEPRILLGTLFRLAGADISIIPTFGGRLSFTRAECTGVAQRLRQSLGSLKPTLPAPAGGLRFEAIADTVSQYGADALFLIGGALLTHGPSLRHSTTAYLNGIRQYFTEHLTEPRRDLVSTG